MTSGIGTLLSAALALGAVVLLIIGSARLLRGHAWPRASPPDRTLALRESVALDSKRRLHLVQCGERQVVLLTGGGQDLVVGWIEASS